MIFRILCAVTLLLASAGTAAAEPLPEITVENISKCLTEGDCETLCPILDVAGWIDNPWQMLIDCTPEH